MLSILETRKKYKIQQVIMSDLMGSTQPALSKIERSNVDRNETNMHRATVLAIRFIADHGLLDEFIALNEKMHDEIYK